MHGSDAGQFDVTRAAKDHLTFGHGAHHCIGAPLARLEAAVALPALFEQRGTLAVAREGATGPAGRTESASARRTHWLPDSKTVFSRAGTRAQALALVRRRASCPSFPPALISIRSAARPVNYLPAS